MKRLTILRHAKAEPEHPGQEDWDRDLEARGRKDAPEMGRRLRERGLKPDRIVSSPAVRALNTATLVAGELGIAAKKILQDERLYLAAPKVLLEVVRELGGDNDHLMIVGHNPGLTEFAERLSDEHEVGNLPTCAVYTLDFDIDDWADLGWHDGLNPQFDYPKNPNV